MRLYENIPDRPYCSDSKRIGRILKKEKAITYRYIQINHPLVLRYIVFDLDYEGSAFSYEEKGLPPPTIAVVNRLNAHTHLIYEIDPVFSKKVSKNTKRLLKDVINAYKEHLGADRVITTQRMLVKNPFHKDWEIIVNERSYTLRDLIRELPSPLKRPTRKPKRKKGEKPGLCLVSRNVTLFHLGRHYAYESVSRVRTSENLLSRLLEYLEDLNRNELLRYFSNPLSLSEIRSIAKSMTKWTWKRRNHFIRRQTNSYGTMGFPPMKGLSKKDYLSEVKRRQRLSGIRTARLRRNRTYRILTHAYTEILSKTGRVTQRLLSERSGYSLRTVKYYWSCVKEGAKRSYQGNSRPGPATGTFKRAA